MTLSPTRSKVGSSAAVVIAILIAGSPAFLSPRAARASLLSYQAVAGADGLREQLTVPNAPLSSTVVDAGAPTAQAMLNALGTSTGFAADPYPGETLVSAPGLIAAETPLNPPPYPLIAQSSSPSTPSSSAEGGLLKASSTPDSSSATAYVGSPSQVSGVGYLSATALAKTEANGGVSAEAVETAQDIDFSGILHIGAVRSSAALEETADGRSKPAASLTITGATIAGLPVDITDKGVDTAGQRQALPPASSLMTPLSEAGITVTVVDPKVTATEVLSGALVVTVQQQGDTHTFTFGRADAQLQASNGASSGAPSASGGISSGIPSFPTSNAQPSASPAGASSPVSGSSQSGTSQMASPSVGPAAASSTGPPAGSGPSSIENVRSSNPTQPASSLVAFARLDNLGLSVLVLLASILVLGGPLLIRTYAVRRPWES